MATQEIDRKATVPFHLKLFYKSGTFHRLDEFQSSSPLPPHLEIYTWSNCTLRELSQHIVTNIPDHLPSPPIGTRLVFRLVFPDTKASHARSQGPGRYTSRDLGTVVIGAGLPSSSNLQPRASNNENVDPNFNTPEPHDSGNGTEEKPTGFNGQIDSLTEGQKETIRGGLISGDCGGQPDKELQDARFMIGDYIDCAILPPLSNGDIAPSPEVHPISQNHTSPAHVYSLSGAGGRGGHGRNGSGDAAADFVHPSRLGQIPGTGGAGSWRSGQQSDFTGGRGGVLGGSRENGYGGFRANGGGRGGGRGGNVGYGREEVPVGEWRRGERLPDAGPRGGQNYGYGRGRAGGRW